MPSVIAVVVNYNRRDDTLECLDSLQRVPSPALDVLVVDNGSSDGSVEAIRARFPGVTVIEAGTNLGYPGGNNLGIERALERGAEYLFILNNDIVVDPDIVQALVDVAEHDMAVGMVCPKVYYYDRRDVIWSAGSRIDMRTGTPLLRGCGEVDRGQYDAECPVEVIDGCAILVTRRLCEQVGLIDPTYFAYYEDTDWAIRATRAGFRIIYTPRARAWHKVSATNRSGTARSPFQVYYHIRNHLLFLSRYSRITTGKHVEMWGTVAFNVLKVLVGYDRERSLARLRGITDYYRGRFGHRVSL
ncbi:MAG: glycosyltransferase family 2 protein [Candidatus Latescibacteria bacterium]|nr:glycosyltransferase family 2 protein [Candidatus Latescibacterota bacterium]